MFVVVYRTEQVRPTGALGDAEPVSACPVLVSRPEHQRREQPTVADSERKSRDCSERLVNKRGPTRHGRVSECVGGRWSVGWRPDRHLLSAAGDGDWRDCAGAADSA